MPRPLRPWHLASAALVATVATLVLLQRASSPGPISPRPGSIASAPAIQLSPAPSPPPPAPASVSASASPDASARHAADASLNAALLAWTGRHLATPEAGRAALHPEGVRLARERRATLAALIRTDPEAALASTFPRDLRAQLPAAVTAELETLVSARAELEVIQSCFHPPGLAHAAGDDLHRATQIDGQFYEVHVYGSRLRDASLRATSLHGIALDGHLAVSDQRFRLLDAGEHPALASSPPGSIAVEADGRLAILPSPDALDRFAADLIASEHNPVLVEADGAAGTSTVSGRPSQGWTHGAKKLLVIRVDFSDLTGTPRNKYDGNAEITPAYVDNVLNGANGVRAFLQKNSYGKADLLFASATDLTPVLRMPQTAVAYATDPSSTRNHVLHTHARAAALADGYDASHYDRVAVVFSSLGDIGGSYFSYAGLANIIGANLWINGEFDLRVLGHELGHTHGLRHSNLWKPPGSDPVSLAGDDPGTETDERSVEYGDPFDLMGGGNHFENDFSHWNKSLLQWIPDSAVLTVAASGTYRVHRFDASDASLSASRALKIVRDSTRDYWIGYRRGLSSPATDNGAYVLWGYNTAAQGQLLDLVTPGTNPLDAPLPLHTTFHDSAAGISIRPVAQGGSGADEWLDIEIALQPRIQWSSPSYLVNEQGGVATLTVTRSSNSTGSVSVSYATTAGTATAVADFTPATGTLTWADGDSTPRTISIPLVADSLVEGSETFTVTLSSPVGGVIVEPASATVTIADPGARDTTFLADFINNTVARAIVLPDGKILAIGWFSTIYTDSGALPRAHVARFLPDGAVDPDFDPSTGPANGTLLYALARQPDGKILVGGNFTAFAGAPRGCIARLNADGSLDPTFAPGGANATIYDILVQADGRILVAGAFTTLNGVAREYVARLLPNGSLDTTFTGPDFAQTDGWRAEALALQPDGKILVGGSFYFTGGGGNRAGLCRLLPAGGLDPAFNGVAQGAHLLGNTSFLLSVQRIVPQTDGRILIAGQFTAFNNTARNYIARLTATGALDTAYAPSPDAIVNTLLDLPDGSTLIGGGFTTVGGASASRIARLTPAGTLDTAFAAAGGHGGEVRDLALQPDGNVVLAGAHAAFQGSEDTTSLWRLVPGLAGTHGVVQFSADALVAIEGASATLSVTRTGGSLGALAVGYATVAGTAAAGADYTPVSGTLTWADGDAAAKTILVPIAADSIAEPAETLSVNLAAPLVGGVVLGERQQTTLTIQTAFAAWQASRFTAAELSNPSVSGDNADPDGDGLPNLAEFALGRDPRLADSAAAWTTGVQNVVGVNYLTITFRRRVPALDLAYIVQSSGDLAGAWSSTPVQVGSAIANGDGTETVTYRDTVSSSSSPRRFLRVQINRTP